MSSSLGVNSQTLVISTENPTPESKVFSHSKSSHFGDPPAKSAKSLARTEEQPEIGIGKDKDIYYNGEYIGTLKPGCSIIGTVVDGKYYDLQGKPVELSDPLTGQEPVAKKEAPPKVSFKVKLERLYTPLDLKTASGWSRLVLAILSVATVIIPIIHLVYLAKAKLANKNALSSITPLVSLVGQTDDQSTRLGKKKALGKDA